MYMCRYDEMADDEIMAAMELALTAFTTLYIKLKKMRDEERLAVVLKILPGGARADGIKPGAETIEFRGVSLEDGD